MPFKATHFIHLTNSFRGYHFQFVLDLILYDTRPFEHEFFERISHAFPFVRYLLVHNLKPQKKNHQTETVHDKQFFSKISFPYLFRLRLTNAHIDYANQLLHHTNAYISHVFTPSRSYEKLVTVTDNFTNDKTRDICGQLKRLVLDQLLVHPEHFYLYFSSLMREVRSN